ncbi:MAG: hypothetical protein E7453_09270 [Ruminococcaceae bacterium]|nr:hypothetical protein [Oscillospiraceae bacterium]
MASFSKNIDDVKLKTYEDVVAFYDLLSNTSLELGLTKPKIETHTQFYIGKISCVCKNYEEFVENAYGADSFKIIALDFFIYDGSNRVVYIGYIGLGRVSASADSRVMLEKFLLQLQKEQKMIKNRNQVSSQHIVDSVVINGSGNIVANNGGNVVTKEMEKKNRVKDFFLGVLENITSNLIWYILTFAAGLLLAYLTTR